MPKALVFRIVQDSEMAHHIPHQWESAFMAYAKRRVQAWLLEWGDLISRMGHCNGVIWVQIWKHHCKSLLIAFVLWWNISFVMEVVSYKITSNFKTLLFSSLIILECASFLFYNLPYFLSQQPLIHQLGNKCNSYVNKSNLLFINVWMFLNVEI